MEEIKGTDDFILLTGARVLQVKELPEVLRAFLRLPQEKRAKTLFIDFDNLKWTTEVSSD